VEQPPQSLLDRVMDAFIGVWMIVFGLAILAGLALLGSFKPQDSWAAIGAAACCVLYALVGELFILEGLRRSSCRTTASGG